MSLTSLTRLAIIDNSKCKPTKCRQECRKICPVVQMGKLCIEVKTNAEIAEDLCTGCGACVKRCPFKAITIINLPTNLEAETVHRYGKNSFKLHRLPQPRRGEILGLIGNNGLGKSTILKILAGKQVPNLGIIGDKDWDAVIKHFRGSDLQNYFTKISKASVVIKPQYVNFVPKLVKGTISDHLTDQTLIEKCGLSHLLARDISKLSGGELQKFCIAVALSKKADVTLIDEFTNFLDANSRIKMAEVIQEHLNPDRYVVVVEHDISILDYVSDQICLLTGQPSIYGVVSAPFNVRDGINIWLSGYLPTENLQFRKEELIFTLPVQLPESEKRATIPYPSFSSTQGEFTLNSDEGNFSQSEIIILVGNNGLGKSTFLNSFRKHMSVSYKPQMIDITFQGTVRQLLYSKITSAMVDLSFQRAVVKPLKIEDILDNELQYLSGGEIQRVALCLCLGRPAEIYLIDEPSANLDAEMRMEVSRILRRFIINNKKTAFIVEHDFTMVLNLADRVMVFEGQPGISGHGSAPESLETGMNRFLGQLGITYRLDPTTLRHRINKQGSIKDHEQKNSGQYFLKC